VNCWYVNCWYVNCWCVGSCSDSAALPLLDVELDQALRYDIAVLLLPHDARGGDE